MRPRVLRTALGLVFLASCGASPAMRAAERGDLTSLRVEIGAREKAGDLSNGEAAKVARVVADRELRNAKGDDVMKRLRDARMCAPDLDDAFEERMKTHDLAGAEAASILFDDGLLSKGTARDWKNDPDDAWRAIATRTLTGDDEAAARRKAFTDPGPKTRRAAMRAAAATRDASEVDALMEAARLDPEPVVRTEALRAATAIVPQEKASALVTKLRDLWQTGDDALREDIAVAWALPKIYAAGGREALAVLVAGGSGPGAVAGAGAILRAPHADKPLAATARALLARTIDNATHRDRMHALAIVPLDDASLLSAVKKASSEDEADPVVRVAALGKLTQKDSEKDAAVRALEKIAANKDEAELAARAKAALAHAGDLRIQSWLEADLAAEDPQARLAAADSLAALGRSARGAPLLADKDAAVRTRAACTLIVAARVTPR